MGAAGALTFRFGLIVGGSDAKSVQNRMDDKVSAPYRGDIKTELDSGTPLDCLWLENRRPGKGSGQWVYVAASDNTVKAYKFDGQTLDLTDTLRGHSDWVYALASSPDGTRLASASGDGSVKLLGPCRPQPAGHTRATFAGQGRLADRYRAGIFCHLDPCRGAGEDRRGARRRKSPANAGREDAGGRQTMISLQSRISTMRNHTLAILSLGWFPLCLLAATACRAQEATGPVILFIFPRGRAVGQDG